MFSCADEMIGPKSLTFFTGSVLIPRMCLSQLKCFLLIKTSRSLRDYTSQDSLTQSVVAFVRFHPLLFPEVVNEHFFELSDIFHFCRIASSVAVVVLHAKPANMSFM